MAPVGSVLTKPSGNGRNPHPVSHPACRQKTDDQTSTRDVSLSHQSRAKTPSSTGIETRREVVMPPVVQTSRTRAGAAVQLPVRQAKTANPRALQCVLQRLAS